MTLLPRTTRAAVRPSSTLASPCTCASLGPPAAFRGTCVPGSRLAPRVCRTRFPLFSCWLAGDDVDEAAVTNVVLGQFEKVQRSKSKWKVVLKDCILTLNGRDFLVRRCTGEMDF